MGAVLNHRGYYVSWQLILFALFFCAHVATINLHIHRKKLLPFGIAGPLCFHFRALVKCFPGPGTLVLRQLL